MVIQSIKKSWDLSRKIDKYEQNKNADFGNE